jgi:hypothetical protein
VLASVWCSLFAWCLFCFGGSGSLLLASSCASRVWYPNAGMPPKEICHWLVLAGKVCAHKPPVMSSVFSPLYSGRKRFNFACACCCCAA